MGHLTKPGQLMAGTVGLGSVGLALEALLGAVKAALGTAHPITLLPRPQGRGNPERASTSTSTFLFTLVSCFLQVETGWLVGVTGEKFSWGLEGRSSGPRFQPLYACFPTEGLA